MSAARDEFPRGPGEALQGESGERPACAEPNAPRHEAERADTAHAAARFARARERLEEFLALAPAARAAALAELARADAGLAGELERLLAAAARTEDDFLVAPGPRARPGLRLGDFTLVEELGRGGMGTVFLARQESPARTVALKVVRAGRGHDARRLALEAEAMARLSHPDIARVFAAGTHVERFGTLAWVAMEHVGGARPLCAFARELALDARLALFERLCAAVQHGHQHGVVHCDLKSENVLVDGEGALKVIDFGIARLVGEEEGARRGEISGSLASMSPEQARGATPDVQSDVYALGALLHELLSGAAPLELGGLALDVALRRIQEEEPAPPSRRVPGLAPELDAIVRTALAKDPALRYAGAHALAEDVRRFRADEPIRAAPPGPARRLQLAARRHRLAVGASALVLATLAVATIVSLRFAFRAVRAAEEEHVARVQAEHLIALQRSLFESARPRTALGRALTVRELLDDARFQAERTLVDEPAVLGELLALLAQTYLDVGEYEPAVELFERALELLPPDAPLARRAALLSPLGHAFLLRGEYERAEAVLGEARAALEPDDAAQGPLFVWTLVRTGELLRARGRAAEGLALLEEARALVEGLPAEHGNLRARLYDQLGALARQEGDLARAAELHRAALELQRPLLPPHHPALAGSENALANALFELGETEEAAALWRSALATFEAVLDPGHPDLVTVLANLSLVHERAREFDEARALLVRATELRRTALGPAHPRTRALERRRADLELAAGDPEAACRLADAVLVAERAAVGGVSGSADDPLGLEQALFSLALAERAAGRTGDARSHLEECLALQELRLAPEHLELAQGRTLLGSLYLAEDEHAAAAEVLEAAVRVRRAKLPGHWLTANTESLYGAALLALGEVERAAPLLRDAVPVLERALGADDYRTREARARALELP